MDDEIDNISDGISIDLTEDDENSNSEGEYSVPSDAEEDGRSEAEAEGDDETEDDGVVIVDKRESDISKEIPYTFITGDERNLKNNFLSKYEYTHLIGRRAEQIEKMSPGPHEKTKSHPLSHMLTDSLSIAKFELDDVSIPFPFYILRSINIPKNNKEIKKYEIWDVRELKLPYEIEYMNKKMKEGKLDPVLMEYIDPFYRSLPVFKSDI